MNYLDPEYQEFLRRQMLGQAEPVMLNQALVPPEPMAQEMGEPITEAPVEQPKPMSELEQIQARIGQASAQTQDAAKQYQDWLAGLGGRFRSDMEKQSQALEGATQGAREQGLLHQSTGRNLALLGLKDAAQPYQQMAVQAAQLEGQAPQKQQQLFSDYLQKVAGLEGRGLESKMEMAGRLEQGARGEMTKYQDRLSQEMRHAQSMLAAAQNAGEQRKWQEEMKRLEIASREAQSAADRSFRASEGSLNRAATLEGKRAKGGGQGGAGLPNSALAKLADIEAAEMQIEELSKLWDQLASEAGSSGQQFIPDTNANLYAKRLPSFIQSIGVGLEGGKMTDKDVPKYKKMMPSNASTKMQKEALIDALRTQARLKKQAILNAYSQGGGQQSTESLIEELKSLQGEQ